MERNCGQIDVTSIRNFSPPQRFDNLAKLFAFFWRLQRIMISQSEAKAFQPLISKSDRNGIVPTKCAIGSQ